MASFAKASEDRLNAFRSDQQKHHLEEQARRNAIFSEWNSRIMKQQLDRASRRAAWEKSMEDRRADNEQEMMKQDNERRGNFHRKQAEEQREFQEKQRRARERWEKEHKTWRKNQVDSFKRQEEQGQEHFERNEKSMADREREQGLAVQRAEEQRQRLWNKENAASRDEWRENRDKFENDHKKRIKEVDMELQRRERESSGLGSVSAVSDSGESMESESQEGD